MDGGFPPQDRRWCQRVFLHAYAVWAPRRRVAWRPVYAHGNHKEYNETCGLPRGINMCGSWISVFVVFACVPLACCHCSLSHLSLSLFLSLLCPLFPSPVFLPRRDVHRVMQGKVALCRHEPVPSASLALKMTLCDPCRAPNSLLRRSQPLSSRTGS